MGITYFWSYELDMTKMLAAAVLVFSCLSSYGASPKPKRFPDSEIRSLLSKEGIDDIQSIDQYRFEAHESGLDWFTQVVEYPKDVGAKTCVEKFHNVVINSGATGYTLKERQDGLTIALMPCSEARPPHFFANVNISGAYPSAETIGELANLILSALPRRMSDHRRITFESSEVKKVFNMITQYDVAAVSAFNTNDSSATILFSAKRAPFSLWVTVSKTIDGTIDVKVSRADELE
jgi:hypothetical protein